MFKKMVISSMAFFTLLSGCTTPAPKPHSNPPSAKPVYDIKQLDRRIVHANNRFGLQLYRQIIQTEKGKNILISPLSIAMALSMTYNGANGKTEEAMKKVLQFRELSIDEVNKGNAVLKDLLTHSGTGLQLSIANSLWVKKGWKFHDSFLQNTKKYYGADLSALDFSNAKIINDWIKRNTNNKISKIVEEPIDPDTVLFLINAVYFKGNWARPFQESATEKDQFQLPNGSSRSVPMMSQSGQFEYLQHEFFQAIRLPYEGGNMNLLVILPTEKTDLDNLLQILSADPNSWSRPFPKKEGTIRLPRFKTAYETELNDALKSLGMGIAFDPYHADFEKMAPIPPNTNLFISNVKHKSFVEVNEKGTEAAAATSVEMQVTSAPADSFQMTVNRPFFFAIEDRRTGTLLFLGSIYNPL
ncbi:serpin family protein [Lihuaxuella thermophila]|uniref:Serpin B n=1 Tax=Lihuaxuella thermophila TaxID=1173111 RepID=A0A1H8BM20_9BACL|nr:serpin family protein [Lihuaxuella thermophila]SEM83905.1 serpin B [Lihuaxuella thermophila]